MVHLSTLGRATAALAAVGLAVTGPAVPGAVSAFDPADLESMLEAGAVLAHVVAGVWVLTVVALSTSIRGAGVARRIAPRWMLRVLVVGVVGSATVLPAHADGSRVDGPHLDGLRLPDRPVTATAEVPAAHPEAAHPETARPDTTRPEVTVAAGDSLWAIAADRLGPSAGPARIAASVAAWHAHNRDVIGPDPDLIHPGQRLTPPQEDPA